MLRLSVLLLVGAHSLLHAQNVEFQQRSDPPGVIDIVEFPLLGSEVTTTSAPSSSGGYRFTEWTLNGSRISYPSGRARNPVRFIINQPTDAVASYLLASEDSDADGLADWLEIYYFGNLGQDEDSDADGDGFSNRTDLDRGYDPSVRDMVDAGGISRRRSDLVALDLGTVEDPDEDRDGFVKSVEDFRGYSDKYADRLTDGGVSRRRSASQVVRVADGFVRLEERSNPPGIVTQVRTLATGSTVDLSTAPLTQSGYRYTGWFVDGARVDTPPEYQPISLTVDQDTVATARYIHQSEDTDGDGIADWIEWLYYESLKHNLESDPDGDGFDWATETFKGYSIFAKDTLADGGVSRRRSASLVVDTTGRIPYRILSDPPGMVNVRELAPVGEIITTPNLGSSSAGDHRFAYWTLNGERQADAGGYSRTMFTFQLSEESEAIAHFFRTGIDDDFDGIDDLYELRHFGTLDHSDSSDTDGDGFSMAGEIFRGYQPQVADRLAPGGISRRRSVSLPVNLLELSVPPYVTANGPTDVTPTSARLNASVNPAGLDTTVYFEFGPTPSYGGTSPVLNVGAGTLPVAAAFEVTGLEPASVYHFRVVAENSEGVRTTADTTFSTLWDPTLVTEGFETGESMDRWQVVGGAWAAGVPESGPAGAFAGDGSVGTNLNGPYLPQTDARLISPIFDVPSLGQLPHLEFSHWWDFGSGDYGLVEVRLGTTGTWQPLAAYTGSSEEWTPKMLDLSSFAGRRIQVAFRLVSDNDGSTGDGWFLDEVRLVTGEMIEWLPDTFDPLLTEVFRTDWTANHPIWQGGQPTSGPGAAFEGETCAATGLDGNYPASTSGRLSSPYFRMPEDAQNPRLRFWHWHRFGSGDLGVVELRRLGGPWQPLSSFSGSGGDAWSKPSIDVVGEPGEWYQIGFRLFSDQSGQAEGWFIDLPEIVTGADVLNNPESFDENIGDWTTDSGGIWQIGQPTAGPGSAYSGSNVAGTNLSGNYPVNSVARMISPEFVVGDPGPRRVVTLRYWQWYQYGNGDGGTLEISVQDGDIWSDWIALSEVAGSSGGWEESLVDLNAYRGRNVRLGFRHSADGDGSTSRGWYLDDIEVTSLVRGVLTPGIPVRNDLTSDREFQYYTLELNEAGPLSVSLANGGAGNRLELHLSRGLLPSRGTSDFRSASGPGSDREVLVPWAAPGVWYVLVYADTVVTPGSFSLVADSISVSLTAASPSIQASNISLEMALEGAGFGSVNAVELVPVSGGSPVSGSVSVNSFSRLTASFSSGAIPPGDYDVVVRASDGSSASLSGAFTSLASGEPELETRLIMPGAIGPRATATIHVEYANTGTASMPAPLMVLRGSGGANVPILTLDRSQLVRTFWAGGSTLAPGASSEVAILASGETPGVLHPGERMQVPVYFAGLQDGWNELSTGFELVYWTADDPAPINWSGREAFLRPPTLSSAVWGVIYENLTSGLATTADYVSMLNDNARYLGRLGQSVVDAGELWNFEVQQAYGISPVSAVDSSTDLNVAVPGTPLSLARSFAPTLQSRYQTGPFGRGWFMPWQSRMQVEQDGGVVRLVGEGGGTRTYSRDVRDASFFADNGDSSRLISLAGGYQITAPDGSVTRISSLGQIGYIQDSNGNRVTASYDGDRLMKLQHSSGAFIELDYNGAGRIVEAADSAGRTVTYGYVGDYLVSATTDDGKETTYAYDTSGPPSTRHALTSVLQQGVQRNISWDARGRVQAMWLSDNQERVDFAYDSAGGVSISDAYGTGRQLFDHRGLLAQIIDPLGNVTANEYNEDFRIERQILPSGDTRSYAWCGCGSPTQISDELGYITRFEYNHPLKKLTAFTDAKGNRTTYQYDAAGNLLATIYPDNSESTASNHTGAGLPQAQTNRRGQTTTLAYNTAGFVASRSLPEGDSADFSYDARGNLIQVTEYPVDGGEEITTYDYSIETDGDRLRKVTYPDAGWVEYFYDEHGRRSRIIDSAGGDTRYEYDTAGRLATLRDSNDAVLVEYFYDDAGRQSRTEKRNGTYTTYEYDEAGRILNIVNYSSEHLANTYFRYTYDERGRKISMTKTDGTWKYAYDGTGQLINAIFEPSTPDDSNLDLNYYYDALGNRTSTTFDGRFVNYLSNNLNQYTSTDSHVHEYDDNGNLTYNEIETFTYNSRNLLTRVIGLDGVTSFEYDPFGNRTATVRNGVRTTYLLDPTGTVPVLAETSEEGGFRSLHGLGLEGKIYGPSTTNFFDFDDLGSIASVTGQSGAILSSRSYLPFGAIHHSDGPLLDPDGYVARFGVRAETSDRVLMGLRSYSLSLGRFLQADPIGLLGGDPNFYRYVGNHSTGAIDPFGRSGIAVNTEFGGGIPIPGGHLTFGGGWSVGSNGICVSGNGGLGTGIPKFKFAKTVGFMPETGWDGVTGSVNVGVIQMSANWKPGQTNGSPTVGVSNSVGLGASVTTGGTYCFPRRPSTPTTSSGAPPGIGPGIKGDSGVIALRIARDPNEKLPPTGVGEANWIPATGAIPYRVNFENIGPGSKDPNGDPYPEFATAPAQRVVITDQLPADLDWTTFRVTELGFGDEVVAVPGNTSHFAGTLTMTFNDVEFDVEMEAGIDFNTGEVRVVFQSILPGLGLPPDVDTGFLPPEDGTGRGKGHFTFLIEPKPDLPNGTAIRNVAVILFDANEVIATNQIDPQDASKGTDPAKEALITLDDGPPDVAFSPLPETSVEENLLVAWSGDDRGGVGVATYDVFVSIDDGPFALWLDDTPDTEAIYNGRFGQRLAFRATATDFLGQESDSTDQAQASTTLVDVISYAFGLPPGGTASTDDLKRLPAGVVDRSSGKGGVEFGLPVAGPEDVTLVVESSANLLIGSWSEVARKVGRNDWVIADPQKTTIEIAPAGEIQWHRLTDPPERRKFYRVRATLEQ